MFKAKVVSLLNSQLETIKQYSDINIDTDKVIRSSAEAVEVIKSDINDIPDMPEDSDLDLGKLNSSIAAQIEKVTQELPRIKLDENGEYVPVND